MPNWCYSTIVFRGDAQEVRTLYNLLDDCETHPEQFANSKYPKTDFGSKWLGYPLVKVGLQDCIDSANAERNLKCRGEILDFEYHRYENSDEADLMIQTYTAWCPMIQMWNAILKKLNLNSVKFCVEAEEPGCEIYVIYNPDNLDYFDNEEIYVDTYLSEPSLCPRLIQEFNENRYMNEDEFLSMVSKAAERKITDFKEAVDYVESFNDKIGEDDFVYVHRYERDDDIDNYC